ncbi:MAG: CCA tRNA nucleotidyltransferase [Alphaproteobacteria bacterium]|nr:MAG: CCA tRNA nucleotidyltransferase [Alphaproteobacteria bacterium]
MEPSYQLSSLPAWIAYPETERLFTALSADGAETAPRFVGGCVRDALMNRTVCDIDLATPLPPERVMELLKEAKIKYVPTGVEHGTVTAIVDRMPFEVTTLRRDVETDGRHATVSFTENWQEDAARRDFTVNALFCDMGGKVYDFFGGVQDLRQGLIRFIGDAETRIQEDYLRILRFFRFYAHYAGGTSPDETALAACAKYAAEIPQLSKERITHEFLRLLEAKTAARALTFMEETGVLHCVAQQDAALDVLEKLIKLEEHWDTDYDAMRRLAAVFTADVELFRLPRSAEKHWKTLRDPALVKKVWPGMTDFEIRQFVYDNGNSLLRDMLLLAAARERDVKKRDTYRHLYQLATSCRLPRFPVLGKDVMALGIEEGKELGDMLRKVEIWWRDKDFRPGRSDCLAYLQSLVE